MSDDQSGGQQWSRIEGTLLSTARTVRRAYDGALAELGINLTEASVLASLAASPPITQVELARRIGTGRARIGVHVDSLEDKGAVRRDADPSDRRAWLVSLTPNGWKLWERSAEVDRAVRRQLRLGIMRLELEHLDSILLRIQDNAVILLGEDSSGELSARTPTGQSEWTTFA